MLRDLIVVAVALAVFHLELAVVAVFALRKVRKATRNPFAAMGPATTGSTITPNPFIFDHTKTQ